ncbi:MAG: GHMP kinase [Flavobacteriaceae bacterium]|nr:MAG: GHMP kinase [Flavobacteriaceae bacterium]
MEKKFYSNGKLLLTGEYVVLDGALSLAVPTTYGQSLTVKEIDHPQILWKSFDENGTIWFEEIFELNTFKPISDVKNQNKKNIQETLVKICTEAKKLNSDFLKTMTGLEINTHLDFPRDWGLGTSSTLINNIAQWAKIDAYQLLWNSFSGSGYDIACAKHNRPIQYQLTNEHPNVKEVFFDPSFKEQLFFVYLNKKQNSRDAIQQYQKQEFDTTSAITNISDITKAISACKDISLFKELLTEHENILSHILKIPTVKASLFPDYDGAIKSLGAWGGDFILVTGNEKTPEYFISKGFNTIISYSNMVL